jgi:hypothetical protein
MVPSVPTAPEFALLTMLTSAVDGAELVTVVVALAESFAAFASAVALIALAVLVIVPAGAPASTLRTIENVAPRPLGSVAMVQVVVPVPPPGGVAHVKAGPAVCDCDTKVVFAGTTSLSETLEASDGPLFVTLIVYVMSDPDATLGGEPLFDTDRSAAGATVAVVLAELFVGSGSVVVPETLAVFASVAPAARLDGVRRVMLNPALMPAPRVLIVQLTAPPLPTGGLVHANVGPAIWLEETNVDPPGNGSDRVTALASLGPLLDTVRL